MSRPGGWKAVALLAILVCGSLFAGRAAQPSSAQSSAPVQHALTLGDNGTTLTMPVGDTLLLDFGAVRGLAVKIGDPAVLVEAPNASPRGPVYRASAPGRSTLAATGGPPCSTPICPAIAFVFNATIVVTGSPPPVVTVAYPAGWNIVGLPPSGTLPVDAFAWDPNAGKYVTTAAGTPLAAGRGYWAYFATPTTLTLPQASRENTDQFGPAGMWLLVGNPGVGPATVSGADAVFAWDPAAGRYTATTTLAPGAGAWALSNGGPIGLIP